MLSLSTCLSSHVARGRVFAGRHVRPWGTHDGRKRVSRMSTSPRPYARAPQTAVVKVDGCKPSEDGAWLWPECAKLANRAIDPRHHIPRYARRTRASAISVSCEPCRTT